MAKLKYALAALLACVAFVGNAAEKNGKPYYEKSRWDPIHFKPAIENATDEQCLACHKEVLEKSVLPKSPAGVEAAKAKAWYQQVDTYQGEQDTFHRRHLVTPMAKQLMNLKCTTCHQGNDVREEAPTPPTKNAEDAFNLRKMVNTEQTCLKCHGQFPGASMGLPPSWDTVKAGFNNNCLICHAAIRTVRHKVNYLNAEAIEKAGAANGNTCYGCHGGRAWYRISYPYARHAWPGMPAETPAWAKQRPTESEARFLNKTGAK
jgi:nitrate/TMAO reductase-like tetraheme cytochrome c subunit